MTPFNMVAFLRENVWFFSCFLLSLLVGAIALLNINHGDLLLLCSDHRSYTGDGFFYWFTKVGEEVAYLTTFFFLLFVQYRYAIWVPLIGIIVTAVAFGLKSFFRHPRPMAYFKDLGTFDQINLIEGVVMRGGPTSFPSGHTMSAFALYGFISFCLAQKRGVAVLLYAIAFLVGFSRIYLAQHFLEDVYLGAILGVLLAIGFYWLQDRTLSHDSSKWWNGCLLRKKVAA